MNTDQLVITVIGAILNGISLLVGLYIGTRKSAKEVRKEIEDMIKTSETAQAIGKIVTDQKLIDEATKFFKEARELVSSPEAKNFFKNVTEVLKELSGEPKVKIKMPESPSEHSESG